MSWSNVHDAIKDDIEEINNVVMLVSSIPNISLIAKTKIGENLGLKINLLVDDIVGLSSDYIDMLEDIADLARGQK